jgi:hypothetical protein
LSKAKSSALSLEPVPLVNLDERAVLRKVADLEEMVTRTRKQLEDITDLIAGIAVVASYVEAAAKVPELSQEDRGEVYKTLFSGIGETAIHGVRQLLNGERANREWDFKRDFQWFKQDVDARLKPVEAKAPSSIERLVRAWLQQVRGWLQEDKDGLADHEKRISALEGKEPPKK